MSLASANVQAIYASVHGPKKGISIGEARRNRRLKKLEAYGTIPHDRRAPIVVKKADADMAQQEQEMGDGDHATDSGQLDAARDQADRGPDARSDLSASSDGPLGDAESGGPEGSASDGRPDASTDSEPDAASSDAPGGAAQADSAPGEDAQPHGAVLRHMELHGTADSDVNVLQLPPTEADPQGGDSRKVFERTRKAKAKKKR